MLRQEKTDIVVVGTGAAGLFAALSLPRDIKIIMITKDELVNSDSYLAQGGISTLLNEQDYDAYFEDTMRAGRYENREESVEVMIHSSKEIIKELIEYGVEFDCNTDGSFSYTREGAHSTFRILHHKDITGKEITSKLIAQVQKRENISIQTFTTMTDLYIEKGRCQGIFIEDKEGNSRLLLSKSVILATGGIGGIFNSSTNFPHITGDSFALALKHKITLENLHYIQVHPTVLYSKRPGRRFLISESVRGEGAILLNPDGERFVDELLPRDVVTKAIKKEMAKFNTEYVYLSLEKISEEEIKGHFPNIYERCLEEGYDITKEPIPVTPAQHYIMGGIRTDTNGRTSMPGLYAVGETACNGVHGANRLASNSLLESLVFAKRATAKLVRKLPFIEIDDVKDCVQAPIETKEERERKNREIIMDEINRKDEDFYVKWCNYAH